MLTDDETAEYTALRARAFGRDADLLDDHASLERLAELEERARTAVVDVPDSTAVAEVPASSEQSAMARVLAPSTASRGRRTWSRRAVLLVGIPVIVAACAIATAIGAAMGADAAITKPGPKATLNNVYLVGQKEVRDLHAWDHGSPRLLSDLRGTLVWGGTVQDGVKTCVVVIDAAAPQPVEQCAKTDQLTTDGVGVTLVDPATGAHRTFVAWPNGAPVVHFMSTDGSAP